MGFKDDIDKILKYLPEKRQNSLFSATFDRSIKGLALKMLSKNPTQINVKPDTTTAEKVK